MLKGIIFDFDGVIAESVQVKSDAFAELYKSYGQVIVINVVKHHEANGGMSRYEKIKYYHKSFLKIDLSEKEIIDLADQFSALVIDKVIVAPYVPGVFEYIKKCSKKYKLFISTGTPFEEMRQILEARKIAHYFTDVFGSPQKKPFHVNNILSKYNLNPGELIFYGDSDSDMNAAILNNIQFILRIHSLNKEYFRYFVGKTILDFKDIPEDNIRNRR